jgi:hypothetical protein
VQAPTLTTSQRKAARIAGLGYLAIIACGIFAEFIIRGGLIEAGDAGLTAQQIRDAETWFRLSIASDLVMLTFDVVVGIALFVLFRPVSQGMAVLATLLRGIHTAMYGVVLLTLFITLELVNGSGLTGLEAGQRDALALVFAEAQGYGYTLALVFFGLHLAVVGYLAFKSGYVPAILGVMIMAGSAGYLIDCFAQVLLSNYVDYETLFMAIVFVPAFIAELSLAFWLIVKIGGGEPQAKGRAVLASS